MDSKGKRMSHIRVNKVELVKQEKNTILKVTLCNEDTEIYYLEKRELPYHFADTTYYRIFQNGEFISKYRRSPKRKLIKPKFPDGYVAIKPKECLTLNTNLNDFFHFNQNKPIAVFSNSYLSNPITKRLDYVGFEKTLIAK
jgi:hypothetical protein